MIKYRLNCHKGHDFEAWFSNSDAFDGQARRGQVVCPSCGSAKVEKAIMAPAVATRKGENSSAAASQKKGGREIPAEVLHVMRELRREVESKAEYVGPRFAEEARKIHFEETAPRGIYGEASLTEAKELAEDGVPFLPLPKLPEDKN